MPRCPVTGCTRERQPKQLMCKPHWLEVPNDLKEKVVETYQTQVLSHEHRDAMYKAIKYVNDRQPQGLGI